MSIQVPVKPHRRRWFSYSLRSLLLLTAIAAAFLGVWVNRAERQRRAVAAIQEAGGAVVYDFELQYRDLPWLSAWLGPDYVAHAKYVVFRRGSTTDAGLVHLQGLTRLEHLDLHGTQVSDADLAHIRRLTNLKFLDLRGTQVTDAGCDRLLQALPNCWISR